MQWMYRVKKVHITSTIAKYKITLVHIQHSCVAFNGTSVGIYKTFKLIEIHFLAP